MNRRTPFLLTAALAAACTLGSTAFAADNEAADKKATDALKKIAETPAEAPDKLFALDAAMGNLWEVKFGELVASKAQDAKVKDLAQQMVQDHGQANQKLMPIAQKLGLDLPSDLTSEKQGKLDVMAALPVEVLESAYIMDMKADHLKDTTSYADHQKAVKDSDLRSYISETLPKLQMHTQHVMQVAAQKGIGGAPMRGMGGMGGMQHDAAGGAGGGASGSTAGNPNAPGRTSGQDMTGPQPNQTPAR